MALGWVRGGITRPGVTPPGPPSGDLTNYPKQREALTGAFFYVFAVLSATYDNKFLDGRLIRS